MHRFYAPVASFADDGVTLDADETRHLRNVLRLRVGDEVSVFDGEGREFRCSVSEIAKNCSRLTVVESAAPTSPESPLELTLAATILNGEKYDLIIQKAVELGVAALVPLLTIRCEVKLRDAIKRMDRWHRIALEATKQSGRGCIMEIAEPSTFERVIAGSKDAHLALFSERDGSDFSGLTQAAKMTVLIGPKGGWDDEELEMARSRHLPVITLGGRILRAETAAIAVTAILQHRFGDLN